MLIISYDLLFEKQIVDDNPKNRLCTINSVPTVERSLLTSKREMMAQCRIVVNVSVFGSIHFQVVSL